MDYLMRFYLLRFSILANLRYLFHYPHIISQRLDEMFDIIYTVETTAFSKVNANLIKTSKTRLQYLQNLDHFV